MSKDYIWQDLEDCGHNILKCEDCNRALTDVWVTKLENIHFKYMALCPYCNGQSKVAEIKGMVSIGGIDQEVVPDAFPTKLKNFKTNSEMVIISVERDS